MLSPSAASASASLLAGSGPSEVPFGWAAAERSPASPVLAWQAEGTGAPGAGPFLQG